MKKKVTAGRLEKQKNIFEMKRSFSCILGLCLLLAAAACTPDDGFSSKKDLPAVGGRKIYTFSPDTQAMLKDPRPLSVPPATSIFKILEDLCRRLEAGYFAEDPDGRLSGVKITLKGVQTIKAGNAAFHVAVVNLSDTDGKSAGYYFQGSTGGLVTFYMLIATLTQPHLNDPLIDGLILQYNGGPLPGLPHIDLSGILTPRSAKRITVQAIEYALQKKTSQRPIVWDTPKKGLLP